MSPERGNIVNIQDYQVRKSRAQFGVNPDSAQIINFPTTEINHSRAISSFDLENSFTKEQAAGSLYLLGSMYLFYKSVECVSDGDYIEGVVLFALGAILAKRGIDMVFGEPKKISSQSQLKLAA